MSKQFQVTDGQRVQSAGKDSVILVCPHTESVGQLQNIMIIRTVPRSEGAGHVLFAWDDGVALMLGVESST